ncbi:MAG: hypothetical protein KKB66_11280 [Alphaproteobacteria bacterium]|nr:hypothetical protein [Alphaproteobacteria bacterium]MBU0804982.1 hypothetical protein [Alphaproteobacteria bacterium]MBU0870481.1 hypothetical protein [Alphaproteobacteria bacterium]MBU1401844.1 hypothetical protein [Alphaproteobacteria bacterium]MBU1591739.1 hypothetical protein [Alphaproteobacteria bacterium]
MSILGSPATQFIPYLLNYRPAPDGSSVALALASIEEGGIDIFVRKIDPPNDLLLTRLPKLQTVDLLWARGAGVLAVSQGWHTEIWDLSGPYRVDVLDARGLGFDWQNSLWLIGPRGDILRRSMPYRTKEVIDGGVIAACGCPTAAWIRRTGAGALEICAPRLHVRSPWILDFDDRPQIRSDDKGTIFVSAETGSGDTRRLQISRCNISGSGTLVLDQVVGLALGRVDAAWQPWCSGKVLFLRHRQATTELFVSTDNPSDSRRISANGFRVSEMAASAATGLVCVVGTRAGSSMPEMTVLKEEGSQWLSVPMGTAEGAPVFNDTGSVLVTPRASGEPADVRVRRMDLPATSEVDQATNLTVEHNEDQLVEGRVVLFLGTLGGRRYIGRSTNFFQHTLSDIARQIASSTRVRLVNLAALSESAPSTLATAVASLKSWGERRGANAILVAGSVGAACALRALANQKWLGQILVSPVYSPWTCGLTFWQHILGEDDGRDHIRLAETCRTPTIVLHGTRDEVSPFSQSSEFTLRAPCPVTTVPLPESHIFTNPKSWVTAAHEAGLFAERQFAIGHVHD